MRKFLIACTESSNWLYETTSYEELHGEEPAPEFIKDVGVYFASSQECVNKIYSMTGTDKSISIKFVPLPEYNISREKFVPLPQYNISQEESDGSNRPYNVWQGEFQDNTYRVVSFRKTLIVEYREIDALGNDRWSEVGPGGLIRVSVIEQALICVSDRYRTSGGSRYYPS